MHVAADGDLVRPDDRHVVLGLAGDDAGVAADAGRVVDHHRPFVSVVVVRRIKRRRIGARFAQAQIGLAQIGERKPRLQVFGFAFQFEEMLREQEILVAPGTFDRDIRDRPGRMRRAQAIHVKTDAGAHRAGSAAAVTQRRRDGAGRLALPHQYRRFENECRRR